MSEPKSELVPRGQGALVAADEATSFLQMIERAARDPSVDIDKMERLMQMRERMMARTAETAFNQALAEMQVELPEIPRTGTIKNKTGGVQSRYAKWEDLNEIIKPILSKHGFALTFRTGNEAAKIAVTGILSHAGGHSVSSTMNLPIDSSGSKNEVQGLGSSTSYGKRYVAGALLNLTSRGEDNDGAGAAAAHEMGTERKNELLEGIAGVKDRKGAEAMWQSVAAECTKVGDIPAYNELKAAVAARVKALEATK